MAELAVTAMGPDRPGIVAAVASALLDTGGNVHDSAMTILGGRFSLALLVATESTADELRVALARATDGLGLHLTVDDVTTSDAAPAPSAPTHLLSVYGSDQPGILAGVARALADEGANVTDLSTRLLGTDDPVYAMVVELAATDGESLRTTLDAVTERLGVDWSLRAHNDVTY